jgi:hypothetical protein
VRAFLAAFFFLAGCAETHVRLAANGRPAEAVLAGDAARVHLVLRQNSAVLDIDRMNHTAATNARGQNITRAGNAGTSIITAAAAHLLVP